MWLNVLSKGDRRPGPLCTHPISGPDPGLDEILWETSSWQMSSWGWQTVLFLG